MQLGEVGGQGRVVDLAAAEPGVEPAERAGVGPPGVRADGGLDEAARGLCRAADRGLFGVVLAGESFMLKAIIGNHCALSGAPFNAVIYCSTGACVRHDDRA